METLREQFAIEGAMRRRIMRRVWYAFTLSILLRPALVLGFLFGASVIAFWKLASITSIINNILNVRIGEVPSYVTNSLISADTASLIVFSIIVTVGVVASLKALKYLKGLPQHTAPLAWQRV